jgi:hypothetical protein
MESHSDLELFTCPKTSTHVEGKAWNRAGTPPPATHIEGNSGAVGFLWKSI